MNNFNDIKNLWQTARIDDLPGPKKIMNTIKRYRVKQVMKRLLLIAFTLIIMAVMIWVVFVYRSSLLSTRLGEACFFLAMFILIGTNANALNRISAQKVCSNDDFIRYLKQEQLKLIAFHKRTQVTGFGLSALGLGLYLFELVYHHTTWLIVGYSLLAIYILVCWFIVRPIAFRKKTKKLREFISTLEKLSGQLSNS